MTERSAYDWLKETKGKRQKLVTRKRVHEATLADEGLGICCACGADSEDFCEPDARNYHCSACGQNAVFGAEEIAITLFH
jgi:hypothetical protein